MSKTASATVVETRQATLDELHSAAPDEPAESDAQRDVEEAEAQTGPLAEIAAEVGETTVSQRERSFAAADDQAVREDRVRFAEEEQRVRRGTVADCGVNKRQ